MKRTIAFILTSFMLLSLFLVSGGAVAILEETVYSADYVSKVSPAVKSAFELNADESVEVVIWTTDNTIKTVENEFERLNNTSVNRVADAAAKTDEDFEMAEIQRKIRLKRSIAAREYYNNNYGFAVDILGIDESSIEYVSKYSPLIICKLDQDTAIDVANNKDVETLSLNIDDFTYEADYTESVTPRAITDPTTIDEVKELIGADLVQEAGYDGSGIVLGMYENHVPDITNPAFDGVESRIVCQNGISVGDHPTIVASIMVGNGDSAIAPGFSKLYCAGGSELEGVEWLLDNGVNVINISCAPVWIDVLTETQIYSEYTWHSKWLDHIAYNHAVHVVAATGNEGSTGVSLYAMAYNIISVGNVVDMSGFNHVDDLVINISSSYNPATGTVFRPDLCAPGTHLYIPNVATEIPGASGTSCSAPVVTAAIALLLDYAPTLLEKVSVTKALLLAGVSEDTEHRYYMNTTDYTGYRRYGSGIINIANALTITSHGNYVKSSVQSTQTTRTYSMGSFVSGKPVTVVLFYLKRNRYTSSSADHTEHDQITENPAANLDLYVCTSQNTSSYLERSIMPYGNVEKIMFTPTSAVNLVARIEKITTYQNPYEILLAVAWYQDGTEPIWQ